MPTPRWVPRLVLDVTHLDQLREHGGLPGIRDENALEAAFARLQQKHHHEPDSDLATLAAAYAFGLARAHPFNDGNKRAAFLAAMIFLGLNGQDLDVTETEVVHVVTALAAGSLTEAALASWIRERLIPIRL
jgi:death-on-curing protein